MHFSNARESYADLLIVQCRKTWRNVKLTLKQQFPCRVGKRFQKTSAVCGSITLNFL